MAVTNLIVKTQYTGDGSTVKFSLPMALFIDPNDSNKPLIDVGGDVFVWNNAPGVAVTSGFTVYGPGDPTNPSSLIFNVAPTSGVLITIARELPLTQLSRFAPSQPVPASAIEEGFDKLTMICQQLQEQLDRALKYDITTIINNSNPSPVLPAPIANDYLRWDPTGKFLIDDPGPSITMISGVTWPFLIVFDIQDPVSAGKAPSDYIAGAGSTWHVGDRCYNTAPTPGGYDGWVCTTTGSKTTAVFEPMGPVSRGA